MYDYKGLAQGSYFVEMKQFCISIVMLVLQIYTQDKLTQTTHKHTHKYTGKGTDFFGGKNPILKRQIPYDITYILNLMYGLSEHIYRKGTNSWTWRIDLWLPRGRGTEKSKGAEKS